MIDSLHLSLRPASTKAFKSTCERAKCASFLFLFQLAQDSGRRRRRNDGHPSAEPANDEFVSALAAGMGARLIVEVSPEASESTGAVAAAARQTGGRLVCIIAEEVSLAPTKDVIEESGMDDAVEFKVGDPYQLLPEHERIDFSLVGCKSDPYPGLLELLHVNPRSSVVVANRLRGGKEGPIGEGMEVMMIGKFEEVARTGTAAGGVERRKSAKGSGRRRPHRKSRWVRKIDERGEEHFFRLPMSFEPVRVSGGGRSG
ncbi:hypothetical protein BHM03_00003268 [Ensete ventricosum]|uniref:Uncharacterized protein n=1 Tax=Ensete ventricosum TaxID=4639 RepID=A0A445M9Y4_ENSVE|nr:hypothetical protein BHM03_00003268 [Ensete ventricosum]